MVKTSIAAAQPARQGVEQISGAEMRVAKPGTPRVVLAERRRVHRDVDTPDISVPHLVGDGERHRAGTGCNVDGDALPAPPAQRLDRLLREQLARCPRYENAFPHEQIEAAKRVVALDARNRLAVDTPRDHRREPLLRRAVEHAVENRSE